MPPLERKQAGALKKVVCPMSGGSENTEQWIELAAMIGPGRMVRDRFVRVGDQEAVSAWRNDHANTDVYAGSCCFRGPNRGRVASCPFFLDIDAAADLDEARAQTLRACDLLTERVGIVPESMDLHLSGAKGFDLILPPQVLGDPTGADLIRLWHCLARRMVREGLSHVDLGVYQTARLIRLPNSVNSRSRLYKVPLEYKELRDLHLADILDLAKAPREWDSMAVPVESDRAIAWLAAAREWLQRQSPRRLPDRTHDRAEGWRMPPCIRRIESTILPDGVRHQTYYVLARFFATTGMAQEEAVDRLRELDRRHPVRDPDYLERVVHNAWAHPGFAGCPNPVLELYCDSRMCHAKRLTKAVSAPPKTERGL